MRTRIKISVPFSLAVVLLAQLPQVTIGSIGVRGEPPINKTPCSNPHFGYLHSGSRTDLTAAEIGEYVLSEIGDGKTVTVSPRSKSGIFVKETCPLSVP